MILTGKHVALVNMDACVFRHSAYVEAHNSLGDGACSHTHSAWGEPCYGCSQPFKAHHRREDAERDSLMAVAHFVPRQHDSDSWISRAFGDRK